MVFALGDHPDDGALWVDLIPHVVGEWPLFAHSCRRVAHIPQRVAQRHLRFSVA
jgi:hypothetical protein